MNIIETVLDINDSHYIDSHYPLDKLMLFDIETTGFSPEVTSLYLVGVMFYDTNINNWTMKQFFNDDGLSEVSIIEEFMKFATNFQYIINFNGDGFDIPYICKKLTHYKINYNFNHLTSIDIYKAIRPYKQALYLDNLKQKTIELFLGIDRNDKYSGGDLIKVYNDYLTSKNDKLLKLLLQHNFEDVEGVLLVSDILCYKDLFDGNIDATSATIKDNRFVININITNSIPRRISQGANNILITGLHNNATITLPIIDDTLKFFFKDYKDYYYLPIEDKAIHKSVATYVDKDYREKATKANCYIKKHSKYVMQIKDTVVYGYRYNHNDKITYIDIDDSLLNDIDMLTKYSKHILNYIKKETV